jgi:hypothetical protein
LFCGSPFSVQNYHPLFCVLWPLFIGNVAWSPKHIGPSTFLFFIDLDFFLFFFVSFETSNINVGSTRKISDCKINALKVERVQNTFENLNFSEMTLKMLKMMQIYQKYSFWGFHCFFFYFWFFF